MAGKTTISNSETKIEALQLQSSAYGVTVPLVYGVTRLPGNLLWYGGFQAIPHKETTSSGKGGGVKVVNTTFTYTASVMMGLCHGPIIGVRKVWKGKGLSDGGISAANIVTRTENYAATASITVNYAANFKADVQVRAGINEGYGPYEIALTRDKNYTVTAGNYSMSAGAMSLPGLTNFKIIYQYQNGLQGETSLAALGLSLKTGELGQSTWSYLTTYAPSGGNAGDNALGYSGIAYVYAQDYNLGTGAQVENHTFEVMGSMAYSVSANIPDAVPAIFTLDVIGNGRYGAGFSSLRLGDASVWANYCLASGLLMSPALTEQQEAREVIEQACLLTNTAPVWSGRKLTFIPFGDANLSGNGATYTANVTPVYNLTDDDYCPNDGGDPVKVKRKSQADAYNHVQLEYLDRGNYYNKTIAEAKDTAAIDQYGVRTHSVIQAHWICDANIARNSAQLILQRLLFVRNEYNFSLPFTKFALEPMDLVTLTDSGLGLSNLPVRITRIEETEDGELIVTAEDFPLGVASAATYASHPGLGFQHNYNADPGNIDTPVIFEPPAEYAVGSLEVWAAVRGMNANWGGATVWVSTDNATYKQAGVIYGGSRYGIVSANISAGAANYPVSNITTGVLVSGSNADKDARSTLCYIGGSSPEFFAYTTATLTGNGAYTLSGLAAGLYGTTAANHAAGSSFVRVDDPMAKSGQLDVALIGKPLYFKFTSFNLYGAQEQALSAVSSYNYTVQGGQFQRLHGSFRAVSKGGSDANAPIAAGLWDTNKGTLVVGAARSYNFARISRSNGGVAFSAAYDIYGNSSQAALLAANLNTTTSNYVAVVWCDDEPLANRTEGNLPAAMYRCGASQAVFNSPNFKFRSSYILVGIGGCGEGNGAEIYNGDSNASTNAWCDMFFRIENGGLQVTGTTSTPRTLLDYSYTGDYDATYGATANTNLFDSMGRLTTDNRLLGNLLDATTWAFNTTGNQVGFPAIGDVTESSIVIALAPDNAYRFVWQALANTGTNESGGWVTGNINVDHTKMYRSSVWMQRVSGGDSGALYHGPSPDSVRIHSTGVLDSNPYWKFIRRSELNEGRWYLCVGYVFPSAASNMSALPGGVYDGTTGAKVLDNNSEYRWDANTTVVNQRVYQYYSTANEKAYFWAPRFEVCDGSEPSLKDLMNVVPTDFLGAESATIIRDFGADGSIDWSHGQMPT